ncbi:MAG: hypothetical protein ACI4M3_02000 [Acutalibacteraceae bacterium]
MKKRYCRTEKSDKNQLIRAAYDLVHAFVFALVFIVIIFMSVFRLFTVDTVSVITGFSNDVCIGSLAVYTDTDGRFALARVLGGENQSISIDTKNRKILVNHQKTVAYENDQMIKTLPEKEFTLSAQYLVEKLAVNDKEQQKEYLVIDKGQFKGSVKAVVWPAEQFRIF